MRRIHYHDEARAEFLHEVQYYADINVSLAERYDLAVNAAEQKAAEHPDRWAQYQHGTRRVLDRRFKFSLIYLHTEQEIFVVAIAPFARKPGYWKERVAPQS